MTLEKTRRERLLAEAIFIAADLTDCFHNGEIEAAIKAKVITIEEIVEAFEVSLQDIVRSRSK